MPLEFIATLAFVLVAAWGRRNALTATLAAAWLTSWILALTAPVEVLPLGASIVDAIIGIVALLLWTEFRSQTARIVGVLSLAKLVCHFSISAHFGGGNWTAYAYLVNLSFIAQCVVAGGWFHGLVCFVDRISPWHPVVNLPPNEKTPR